MRKIPSLLESRIDRPPEEKRDREFFKVLYQGLLLALRERNCIGEDLLHAAMEKLQAGREAAL